MDVAVAVAAVVAGVVVAAAVLVGAAGLEGPGRAVRGEKQIKQTQDEPQWIVAQRLLSALTIPGFT